MVAVGEATGLQDVSGEDFSTALAVNDAGQSVGFSDNASCPSCGVDAVLWSPTGKATVLQDVGGVGVSYVGAINDAGQSVGGSLTAAGGLDAVLWSPSGKATVLQDAGGQGTNQDLRHQRRRTERRISYSDPGTTRQCCGRRRERRRCFRKWAISAQLGQRHQRFRAERRIRSREGAGRGAVVAVGQGNRA